MKDNESVNILYEYKESINAVLLEKCRIKHPPSCLLHREDRRESGNPILPEEL